MANTLYPKGRQKFLEGSIAWLTDTIKVTAVDSGYTYDSAHDFFDDVAGGAQIATSSALASKTSTDGVADAADVTLASVPAGDTITGLIVWKDTGSAATSPLLAFYDTKADTTAISIATNGGDITIAWNAGANKMFKL